jgi:hypothetical protein
MKSLRKVLTGIFVAITIGTFAQTNTQTIKGKILDQQSKSPIIGVNVIVLGLPQAKGASTDLDGNYHVTDVPLGRYTIKITFIGYKEQQVPNVLLTAGKETNLNVDLEEQVSVLDEVKVVANSTRNTIEKDLVAVSGKTFDIEATRRFAGSRNDPSRMASNFAGVVGTNDARNDIIIRGNSPSGLLWRLEGIDIPNPSHFGTIGATGGPVTILNNSNLGRSAFLTGAFPSIYGNALSGVFDMQLRNGNNEKHEYMGQLSFNGVELGAEGPFSKKSKASYLINYRYSFLGLLKAIGVDLGTGSAIPKYQDLTFKINVPTEKFGEFTLFGVGGNSNISFLSDPTKDAKNFYSGDGENLSNGTSMGVLGLSNLFRFDSKTSLKTTFAATQTKVSTVLDSLGADLKAYPTYRDNSVVNRMSFHTQFNKKFNAKNLLTIGGIGSEMGVKLQDSVTYTVNKFKKVRSFEGNTSLWQAYTNWQYRPNDNLTLNTGLYYQIFALNNSSSIEPRLGLKYALGEGKSLSLGIGRHSQIQNLSVYFNNEKMEGKYTETNRNLGLTHSNQIVMGYEMPLFKVFRFKTEGYYQGLTDIPVEKEKSSYSLVNAGAGFGNSGASNLVNSGTGRNYGLEFTIEKPFSDNYYVMATTSFYDSKYKGSDGIERNTAFNGKYVVNILGGWEFRTSKKGVLAIDTKITAAGGRRYTPIDLEASIKAGETTGKASEVYSLQYKDYFRTDLKITYRLNRKKVMEEWFLDIQNITNTQNIYSQSFSKKDGAVTTTYQLGFYPMFNYRIFF